MFKCIMALILFFSRIIGFLALITMGVIGLNNYWSEHTTNGFIACIVSIFVIVYSITEIYKDFIEEYKS